MCFQDDFDCRSDVGNDDAWNLKLVAVLVTVAGEDVDAFGTDGMGKFNVRRMIANNEGPREVNVVFVGCDPQEVGARLHALAAIGTLMRTAVDRADAAALFGEATHDVFIDRASLLGADKPLGDAALVGHDEEREALQAPQGRKGLRVELDLRLVSQVAGIVDQRAVDAKT